MSLFDSQMVGISSVCGRHLGTPKSRVLNVLAEQYLIFLVSVPEVLLYLFLTSAFFKNKHGGGSGSKLDLSAVTSWDYCRFLSPVLCPLLSPASGPCFQILLVLLVPGLCSLDWVAGKARPECCGQWYTELEGKGQAQGLPVLNQFEDFYRLALLELKDARRRWGSPVGKALCLPKEVCSAAALEELGEFQCSCVGGEEGFVVELLGIKKGWILASQKTSVKSRRHCSQWHEVLFWTWVASVFYPSCVWEVGVMSIAVLATETR